MPNTQIFIKAVLLFVLVYAFSPLKAQIPISKYLIGQNALAPKEIFEVQNQVKNLAVKPLG